MADPVQPADRHLLEAALAKSVRSGQETVREMIVRELGDPPEIERGDAQFWLDVEAEIGGRIRPELLLLYLATWDVVVASGRKSIGDRGERFAAVRSRQAAAHMSATWRRNLTKVDRWNVCTRTGESFAPSVLTAEAIVPGAPDCLTPLEKKQKSQKVLHSLTSPGHAAGVAKTEATASISKAVLQAAMAKLGLLGDDGGVHEDPQIVWRLEVYDGVEEHCAFCPFMSEIGKPKWSKFCPEGPPAHFGCACGLIVYPADYWPRPQLVKDDVIWAAAKNARIFALDAGGSDAA